MCLHPPSLQRTLDEWLPTLVRYTGLVLLVALTGASIALRTTEYAAGYVPIAGMLLYKGVRDAASPGPVHRDPPEQGP